MASDDRRRRLGRRIAAARKAQGLSQPQLAALVVGRLDGVETVKQSAVSFWESGRSVPTPAKLRALEEVLVDVVPGELHAILWPRRSSFVPRAPGELDVLEAYLDDVARQLEDLSGTVARLGRAVRQARGARGTS